MNLLNELRVLLALNGNKRVPDLEAEIFANFATADFYLNSICKKYNWYDIESPISELAYLYIAEEIHSPWPEAEPILLLTAEDAYYYAVYVLKARWPEAEAIIHTDSTYWSHYCRNLPLA